MIYMGAGEYVKNKIKNIPVNIISLMTYLKNRPEKVVVYGLSIALMIYLVLTMPTPPLPTCYEVTTTITTEAESEFIPNYELNDQERKILEDATDTDKGFHSSCFVSERLIEEPTVSFGSSDPAETTFLSYNLLYDVEAERVDFGIEHIILMMRIVLLGSLMLIIRRSVYENKEESSSNE